MTVPSRTTNTMEISFRVLRKIEIDNHVDSLNIDTTREKVRADKVAAHPVSEVVENPVPVMLQHFGMGVETGVAELCDFLGE